MLPFEKRFAELSKRNNTVQFLLLLSWFSLALLPSNNVQAQTIVFDSKIIASNNPFSICPIGTDTIVIRDTFEIDVPYTPMLGGVPYDRILLVDGGILYWSSNVAFKLGENARILLFNGGRIYPGTDSDIGCNPLKSIYFDVYKLATCSGVGALHNFADINTAGCFDGTGICCDAAISALEDSGRPNDRTLCQPGDSVTLSVLGSGSIDYNYTWSPNVGPGPGPHKVAQNSNTTYSVSIYAIFDPSGIAPPYVLTCGSFATIKINPQINLIANTTSVPCANAATGSVNLTVSGGTAPYRFLWSNGRTTEDLANMPAGTYTVTVTDAKDCTAEKTATIVTLDNTPPVITCPSSANGVATANQCTTTIPGVDAVFSDNCPGPQLSYQISGATTANGTGQVTNTVPFQVGTSTVTYRVFDGSNTVSCQFNVTVADNQFPTATNPPILTGIQCLGNLPAPNASVVTDEADNCGAPTVTYLSQSTIGGLGCPGNPLIISRKYRVADASGNGITVTHFLHVADDSPPVFTQIPADITVNCQSIPTPGATAAVDNCSEDIQITYLGETRVNGSCPDSYILKRTWRAQDNCGNSATAVQNIQVQDDIDPVFTAVPANVTVNCQSVPAVGNPTATDNCDGAVSITFLNEIRTDGACAGTYSLRRTWKAEDNCGNSATAEQIIQVQDVTSPTFTALPANVTVNCDAIPVVGNPVASDNCDAAVAITYIGETRTNGACTDSYTLLRSWRATDDCGNSTTGTQQITVRDQIAPSFTAVPANVTVSCDAIPAAGVPVATDNCDADVTITYNGETRTNGSCANAYALRRQWTATDNCGNTKTATQVITVQDLVKPVFTVVPPNATVSCEAVPSVGLPVATDNCDPSVVVTYQGETRENGACLNAYTLRRRWIATDLCGNTATTEQVIQVEDVTPPVYTSIPDPVTVACDAIPAVGTPSATDNCDLSVSIAYQGETRIDGLCANNYTLERRWIATDNCGNTAVATQVVTVRDLTAPTFSSVPAATMASCENLPAVGTPIATDNCSANVTITYLGESVPGNTGACPGNYALIRTWSAQDACGNSATATQAITVQDVTAPVLVSVPANVTVSCAAIPAVGTPTATDNCDATPTVTYNGATRTNGACPNSYTLKRQWTITDDCGNATTATQTLTVEDVTAPVFSFVPAAATVSCEAIPAVETPTATDDCGAVASITYNGAVRINGACPDSYTLERSWTARDSCGNAATTTQIITVQDVTPPNFNFVPVAVTVNCDAVPAVGNPVATDNCDAAVTVTYLGEVRLTGACPNSYSLRREWVATDNCGNTTPAVQVITVQDVTAPTFTSVPAAVTVSCEAIPAVGAPSATDNCTNNPVITFQGETRTDGACSGNYILTRTWRVQDECGNSATASQLITVRDITKPVVVSTPANVTVSCSDLPAVGTPVATDNCDADLSITYNGATRTNGACANSYTLTRRWTITDDCGNTATAAQILTVEDTEAPVFTSIPAATTATCETIPAVGVPAAFDNCAAAVNITYNGEVRINGACPDSYTLRRTWTARDSCGNSSTAEQVISVQDLTPPNFIMIPSDVTVSCDGIPAVVAPSATDNCDAFVTIDYVGQTRINGNCDHTYLLRREWMATDNCGNTAKATQMVTVQDLTSPEFTFVPQNASVSCDAVPAVGSPSATDNCDPNVAITYLGEIRADGGCPGNYTLTRRWLAKDHCGNEKTATQVITVKDLVKPVFTSIPQDSTVNCDAVPLPGAPTATDNCTANPTIQYIGETVMSSASPDSYTIQRKWTATDECNNVSTALQVLTIQDTISPSIVCPADIIMDANGATCSAIATFSMPVTADNCAATLNVTTTANSGSAFPVGTTNVTMRAIDPTGNMAACSFRVTVKDTTAPKLLNCPADFTVSTSGSSCDAPVSWTAPTVSDACDQYAIVPTVNIPNGSVFPTGIETITYTAVDTSGNSSQCSFKLTVREDVAPVLTNCPQNITVHTNSCTAVVDWTAPIATDNCELQSLEASIAPGSLFPETSTPVQYKATDRWGNTATCGFIVTVIDMVAPTFSGCPDNKVVDAGVCEIPVTWVQPIATDNCGVAPVVFSVPAPGDVFPSGFTTVRVFTEDLSGNQDTCIFVVEVLGPAIGLANHPTSQSFVGCNAVATWTPPVPTGICGPYTLTSNIQPGATFDIGVTEVIYTLTDTLNHSVSTSFTVTVSETIPPQFACPVSPIKVNVSGAILNDPSGFIFSTDTVSTCDGLEMRFPFPTATDNCDSPLVTQEFGQESATAFALGNHTLSFMAKDDAGNTAMCSVQIEVLPLLPLNPQVSDAIACKGDEVTLSATIIGGAQYFWYGPEGPYEDNNNLVITELDQSKTGYYAVAANVNGCITPLDSALVRIGQQPDAIDDLDYQVETNTVLPDFNVLLNDVYEADDYTISVSSEPLTGLINHGEGEFSYEAGNKNSTQYFIYKLCSEACPNLCDEGIVAITVRERICSFIPNLITPNGDDMNDFLVIPCLDVEPYPQNRLVVYNQWGDKVYDVAPYTNDPAKAWRGELFGETGRPLPDATYYYIFKPTPDHEGLKGFVEIFR